MLKNKKVNLKPNLFLHIGFGRTGTSSIQYIIRYLSLFNNFIYNPKNIVEILNNIISKRELNENYSELLKNLKKEYKNKLNSHKNINHNIISLESIIGWDINLREDEYDLLNEIIKSLSELFEISIIITHREPSSLTRSNYLYRNAQYEYPEAFKLCEIINGEMIEDIFRKFNQLKKRGVKDIFFIKMSQISKLNWLEYFGFKSIKSSLLKKELKRIKFNPSKSIESVVLTSLVWKFLKSPFLKFFSNNKGTPLHRFSQRLNNKLHVLFVRILNISIFKFIIKKLIGENRFMNKFNQIKMDLNTILETHKEADKAYFKLFPVE